MRATLISRGYKPGNRIGEGAFSHVFKVYSKQYQCEFVAKVISISDAVGAQKINNFDSYINEITSLRRILHMNVISFYDNFRDSDFLYIIFEFCPNGNLKEFIDRKGPLPKSDFVRVAKQILRGLNACHQMGVAHHDIKPDNIFLDNIMRPKLGDFGLAALNQKNELSTKFQGTNGFYAPEMLQGNPYDPMKADIFALGITYYYLITGSMPWDMTSEQHIYNSIVNVGVIFPPNMDKEVRVLIHSMTAQVPECRLSINELLNLPIFNNQDQLNLQQIQYKPVYSGSLPKLEQRPILKRTPISPSKNKLMNRLFVSSPKFTVYE